MTTRKRYTKDEITLCTYIAIYGPGLLVEKKIAKFGNRSTDSVKMKVQNIAAMLDEKGISRSSRVSPLSGKTTGERGRVTDWPLVQKLLEYEKKELWQRCRMILSRD